MSYTVVGSAGPKPRPRSVSVASLLLYVTSALLVVVGALDLVSYFVVDVPLVPSNKDISPEVAATLGTIVVIVQAVVYVLLAVGLVVLGVFVGKGSNPARIVTWVVGGITVLCCACGLLDSVIGPAMTKELGDTASQDTINQINAAVPGWLKASTTGVSVLILFAMITVVIVLMLPSSNNYFRKEQEVWVPPNWPDDPSGGYPPPPVAPPPVG